MNKNENENKTQQEEHNELEQTTRNQRNTGRQITTIEMNSSREKPGATKHSAEFKSASTLVVNQAKMRRDEDGT